MQGKLCHGKKVNLHCFIPRLRFFRHLFPLLPNIKDQKPSAPRFSSKIPQSLYGDSKSRRSPTATVPSSGLIPDLCIIVNGSRSVGITALCIPHHPICLLPHKRKWVERAPWLSNCPAPEGHPPTLFCLPLPPQKSPEDRPPPRLCIASVLAAPPPNLGAC